MSRFRKPLIYLLGLTILGFSVTLIQKTNLGMGSWDALNRNFYEGIPLDYRYLTPIMAIFLISLAYLIERKKPAIIMLFPIAISFYIGLTIDLFLLIVPSVSNMNLFYNLLYVFLALVIVGIGLNMIIYCKYPLPALDQFCLAISRRLNISFGKGKFIGEVFALVSAVISGLFFSHQEYFFFIGVTTIITVFFVGRFVDFFEKPVLKVLGDKNGN